MRPDCSIGTGRPPPPLVTSRRQDHASRYPRVGSGAPPALLGANGGCRPDILPPALSSHLDHFAILERIIASKQTIGAQSMVAAAADLGATRVVFETDS